MASSTALIRGWPYESKKDGLTAVSSYLLMSTMATQCYFSLLSCHTAIKTGRHALPGMEHISISQ